MPEVGHHLRRQVVPAVPVPFDQRGEIDVAAQRRYAQWMAHQRIGAVAIWAHTGRGLHLADEQRAQVLEAWRRDAPAVPIICGVGSPPGPLPTDHWSRTDTLIRRTVALADAARAGGALAVMVHPPSALGGLPDLPQRVLDLHRAVVEVGLPVLAFYLYEAAGGVGYEPETVEALLQLDGVVGIKVATLDSVMTFQDLAVVVRRHPTAILLTGEDRFLGYSLVLGSHGALIGLAAACTDRCTALLEAWFAGDWPAFIRLTAAIDEFARATFAAPMEGYIQRMLWALEADGVLESEARDPFGPVLDPAERERVRAAVRVLRSG